jgi:hypothetical protein
MRRDKRPALLEISTASAAASRFDVALFFFIVWMVSGGRPGDDTSRAAS